MQFLSVASFKSAIASVEAANAAKAVNVMANSFFILFLLILLTVKCSYAFLVLYCASPC